MGNPSDSLLKITDKEEIRSQLLAALTEQLTVLRRAVETLVDATTHTDARSEGKYDTRAIESGYMAGAQAERLQKLERTVQYITQVPLPLLPADQPVKAASLVTVKFAADNRVVHYFLLDNVGGLEVTIAGQKVAGITPESNLGEELLGAYEGDEVSFRIGDKEREATIIHVC